MKHLKIFLVTALIGLVLISGCIQIGIKPLCLTCTGFSIMGISLANPVVQGQSNEWIVDAYVNGWGQSITGNVAASEIKYSGATAKYPMQIIGSISENKGLYLINNANPKTIYKYSVSEKHGTINDYIVYKTINPPANCDGSPGYIIKIGAPSGLWSPFGYTGSGLVSNICIYKQNTATQSPISSLPNIYPKLNIGININGQTQNVELSSMGAYSLPNGLGSVNWVNSPLQSGSTGALSIGQQYTAIAPYGTENWRVAYANDYSGSGIGQSWSDTANKLDSDLNLLVINPPSAQSIGCTADFNNDGISKLSNCVKDYVSGLAYNPNNIADKLLNSNLNINNMGTSYDSGSRGFWVNLNNVYTTSPQLQFRIKSEWLAITFPNGAPQVISAKGEPYPFKSGSPLTVTIVTKNIGDGVGNFNIQGLTGGTLVAQSQIYPATVQPDETANIVFTMTTSIKQIESGTINGKVVDTGSLREAAFSFAYKMDAPSQCTEGMTYWFGGNKIQKCQDGVLIDFKNCESGVISDGKGGWTCASKSGTEGNTTGVTGDFEIPLRNWTESPLVIVLLLLLTGLGFVIMRIKSKR